jgi:hypothetical protein
MLTKEQIRNIHKLDPDTCIEIMHECAERLGVATADEYADILCLKRRTVYANLERGAIKHVVIGGKKFPCINEK